MVAYKNNYQNKDYKKPDYHSSSSMTTAERPFCNRLNSSHTIDRIVQPSETKELYQKRIVSEPFQREYDLTQPIWFYAIMKKLAMDEEAKKKTSSATPPEYSLN